MKMHHPPHLYLDETCYFITARIYKNQPIFETDLKKRLLLDKIEKQFKKNEYNLYAWVILDDHYHVLFQSRKGDYLTKIMKNIHSGCSFELNKLDVCKGRRVFQNYWDVCIRNQKDFYTYFNYIHHNSIKHCYTKKMEDYAFSSFSDWLKKKGDEWMFNCLEDYPVIDFTLDND